MIKNLTPKMVEVLNEIITFYPDVVFGGSIALLAAGLIDREISDIDLIFLEGKYDDIKFKNTFLKNNWDVFQTNSPWSDVDNVFAERKITRWGISVNGVK